MIKILHRLLSSLLLGCLLCFSIYGFISSFELTTNPNQLAYRVVFILSVTFSLVAIVKVNK